MGFVFTLFFVALTHLSIDHLMPWLAPYRPMIWLSILGLLVSVVTIPQSSKVLKSPVVLIFLAFFFFLPVSRIMRGWFGGAHLALLDFLPTVVLFFLVLINTTTARRAKLLLVVMLLISFYMSVRGIYALHNIPGGSDFLMEQKVIVDKSTWEITDVRRIRSVGFLSDPNDFAQYLLIVLPVVSLAYRRGNIIGNLFLVYLPGMFVLYSVVLTKSRGGMMGFCLMLLLYLRQRVNATLSLLMTGGAIFVAMALQFGAGRAISIGGGTDRLDIWSDGLGMFKSSPLWGVGFKGFTETSRVTAHNSYLLAAAELGLIGLFLWLGMTVFSMTNLARLDRMRKQGLLYEDWAPLVPVVQFSYASFLVTAYFLSRTYSFDLYIMVALAAILSVRAAVPDEGLAEQRAGRMEQPTIPYGYGGASPAMPQPVLGMQSIQESQDTLPFNKWFAYSSLGTIGMLISIYIAVRMRSF